MAPRMTNVQRVEKLLDMLRTLDDSGYQDFTSSLIAHLKLVAADGGTAATAPDAAADDAPQAHRRHPRIVFSYTAQLEHCNRMGNLHGGAIAALFDFCTTLITVVEPDDDDADAENDDNNNTAETDTTGEMENDADIQSWSRLGVSRTLSVTYVRPTPCNTEVLIECEQVHAGRRMVSLRGLLRRRSDGAVLATCEHGKYIPDDHKL